MVSSISDSEKKRGRGRPQTGIGKAIGLRLYPELEAKLQRWIKAQPSPKPSQPEAIRRLLEKALETADDKLYTRGRATEYLREIGCPITERTLERYGSKASGYKGPKVTKRGRAVYYRRSDLDAWAESAVTFVE
jgi:hypothetical protein